jgi:tripartite-type tricarboxylate transporter receptor subunit TctC
VERKKLICSSVMVLLVLGAIIPFALHAQPYPNRNIQLFIPYVPGATGDIKARILAEELEKILGTKIVPMNKPGAASILGTDAAARSKNDGYTMVYASAAGIVYAPASSPETVKYDPVKDLEPLGLHCFFPHVIAVGADSPWKTFPELIDYAKRNPGKLRVSTVGISSTPHFIVEMIQSLTGASFNHIPFKGGETVMTAVLGGHVEVTCDGYAKVKPHADAGKMRVLLVTDKLSWLPEIPTITELGYKQSLVSTWFGLYAPAGLPEDVRKILLPAVEKAVKTTKPQIDRMGSLGEYRSPAELRKLAAEQYEVALALAKKMGLRK